MSKSLDKDIRMCDADYIVSVKEASDRDASRDIGIAQEIGFSTDDKGYIIVLKGGDDESGILNIYDPVVIFVDSFHIHAPPIHLLYASIKISFGIRMLPSIIASSVSSAAE